MVNSGKVVLPDTSLCMIVRDEIMNPAGGIEACLRFHLPHFDDAVIVDTGSLDGTREKLEVLQAEYSQLRVFDHPFDGYGPSRNVSLGQVQNLRALVLDADEVVPNVTFRYLEREMRQNPDHPRYRFTFKSLYPCGEEIGEDVMDIRVVSKDDRFDCVRGENIRKPEGYVLEENYPRKGGLIIHFLPDEEAEGKKGTEWYGGRAFRDEPVVDSRVSPSQTPSFARWKALNSQVKKYNPLVT